jgi:hypothetical protein
MSKERSKDLSIHDLKVGNIVNYETEGDLLPMVIDWQALKWLTEDPIGFNMVHSPIEINEDLLKRLGFNKSGLSNNWYYTGNDLCFYVKEGVDIDLGLNGYLYYEGTFCQIKHLHQLQNLYCSISGVMLSLS